MRGAVIIFLLLLSNLANGQYDVLQSTWNTSNKPVEIGAARVLVADLIQHANKKNPTTDLQLLNRLFEITQRKVLRNYSPYADMSELTRGTYDCLTATSLFAAMLTETGFQFEIIETNYHIFLLVHTSQKDVLLETTDRFNGFVVSKTEIDKRLNCYQQNSLALSAKGKTNYLYQTSLYRAVQPSQLAGLLLFNQAVKAFNAKDLKLCADKLDAARELYETPRVAELADILLQAIVFSNTLTAAEKQVIENKFAVYRGSVGFPVASR